MDSKRSDHMSLGDMTWQETADYLAKSTSLLVPVGTCEQHGRHLPLATDSLVAESLASAISERTGIAIAPTVNYGVNLPSDSHFTGTNSVTASTLERYLAEMLEWWIGQGFERF